MKSLHRSALMAGLVLAIPVTVFAQGSSGSSAATPAPASSPSSSSSSPSSAPASPAAGMQTLDARLLNQMHLNNQIEMRAGELAKANGSTREVRDFGGELEKDHKKADKELTDLAKKKGIELTDITSFASMAGEKKATSGSDSAMEMSPAMKDMADSLSAVEKLRSLSGTQFDREFLTQTISDHDRMIENLEGVKPQISDKKELSLIDSTAKTMQKHRAKAEKLLGKEPSRQNTGGSTK
jgi:putative membrane protein